MPRKYLYHDPAWLRRELKKHRSIRVLCQMHGFKPATVIDYLARHPEVKAQVADLLLPSPPGPGKGTPERARLASLRRHKQDWTVEELREQNLPLYWNHGWLLEQLRELRSVEEVARQHGYKPLTLQSYVFRHPELRRAVEELRLERREKLQGVHLRLPGELSERLAQDPRSKIGLVEKAHRWKMSQTQKQDQNPTREAQEAQEAQDEQQG